MKVIKYKFTVSNDSRNSVHKIIINDELFHQPNVYAIAFETPGETSDPLEESIATIYKHLNVRIMNVNKIAKNIEDLPIIYTLGILATKAVKQRYDENKTLIDGETIQLEAYAERFTEYLH